jgi:hypothetical protein
MSAFPTLKSGAIMQWPATREREFATEVLAFADGSEQRFRHFPRAVLRWVVRLNDLDESEIAAIEAFYTQEQGEFGSFSFTDPWDGTVYPECQFDNPEILADYRGVHQGSTTLIIRELR